MSYGVDVFEVPLPGQIGFETADEYERFQMPDFALANVTTDAFFTGGELARVPETTLRRVLNERLGRR